MAVKKTIAIAGAADEQSAAIIGKLLLLDYRFLLLQNNNPNADRILHDLILKTTATEAELIDCVKEACWEADIIVLANHFAEQKEVAEKIRDVATQKIVLIVLHDESDMAIAEEIESILPYSCIISACIKHASSEVLIVGENEEAVHIIATMMSKASFLPTMVLKKALHF